MKGWWVALMLLLCLWQVQGLRVRQNVGKILQKNENGSKAKAVDAKAFLYNPSNQGNKGHVNIDEGFTKPLTKKGGKKGKKRGRKDRWQVEGEKGEKGQGENIDIKVDTIQEKLDRLIGKKEKKMREGKINKTELKPMNKKVENIQGKQKKKKKGEAGHGKNIDTKVDAMQEKLDRLIAKRDKKMREGTITKPEFKQKNKNVKDIPGKQKKNKKRDRHGDRNKSDKRNGAFDNTMGRKNKTALAIKKDQKQKAWAKKEEMNNLMKTNTATMELVLKTMNDKVLEGLLPQEDPAPFSRLQPGDNYDFQADVMAAARSLAGVAGVLCQTSPNSLTICLPEDEL